MLARLSIVALAALALTGCKKDGQQQAAAPAAPRDCCCKVCPTDAAPAAKATARADASATSAGRQTVRVVRHTPRVQRDYRRRDYAVRTDGETLSGGDYYASGDTGRRYAGGYTGRETGGGYSAEERRYERTEGGYGGRYGVSGRAVSGVSVSVEESESSSERVRYRESSSGYGSSGGYAYASSSYAGSAGGYYEDRQGRVRRAGGAATDRSGYLTWPGKVED